jgi:hypothetical protein
MKTASTVLLTLVASLLPAWATRAQTACSAGTTTPMPEGSLEASFTVSCPGFTFENAQVAIFLDPGPLVAVPSDVITLTNVAGVATITFLSDTEVPITIPALPSGSLSVLSEPNSFFALAVSTVAGISNSELTFTSDADNGTSGPCGSNSDCMTASTVPEPATMGLLGIGLLGSGWIQRRRRQRQVAV